MSKCLHSNAIIESEHGNLIVEIQLHLHGILKCVHDEHKLYEIIRCKSISDVAS